MISCISMGSWPCWKREKKVNKENDACAMTNVLEVEKKILNFIETTLIAVGIELILPKTSQF